MPTTVYRSMTSKNGDQGTYMPMRSPLGMKNSIFVDPGALVLTSPAGDQMGCFSHSTDIYMRDVNRNTIDTEKTNCPTKQPFYRESRLDGGRPSTFARYANEEVSHPRQIYGGMHMPMQYPMMMEQYTLPSKKTGCGMGGMTEDAPMMEQYKQSGRRRENFVADKKKVIMGRMTEGYAPKRREFFTNRCGNR